LLPSYAIIVCCPGVQERPVAIVNVLAPTVIDSDVDDVDVNKSPLIPDVPEVPLVADVPEVPEVPLVADVPEVPDVPAVPAVPVPEVPAVPLVPLEPDVPDVPEVPDVPAFIKPSKNVRLLSISAAVSGAPLGILVTNAIFYNY